MLEIRGAVIFSSMRMSSVNIQVFISVSEAEPPRLNYYNYVADDVAPQTELVSQKSNADDDPASKREER